MRTDRFPGIGFAGWAMRLATHAYPARFRTRFGDELELTFEARCAESWRQRGAVALIAAVARSLLDTLRAGLGERLSFRSSSRVPSPDPPGRLNMISSFLQDIRFALRLLRKNPGFTTVAVLTLALGIGANTAIFTLVYSMLGRPLPGLERQEELFTVYTTERGATGVSAYADYRDFAEQLETAAGIAAYKPREAHISGDDGSEQVSSMMVSGNYFDVLGVNATLGRTLTPADDVNPDAHTVAMISYGLWQRRFAGSPDVVGETLRINGRAFNIVGVTPAGFRGTWLATGPQVYVPMAMQEHMMPGAGYLLESRGWGGILMVGRVGTGNSIDTVAAEIDSVGAWLSDNYAASEGREYQLVPLNEGTLQPEQRGMVVQLGALLGAVSGLVLLIACVNVANLLLARATRRTSEIAVRQALGAGQRRIFGQLLAESLVLSTLGGLVGIGFGAILARGVGQLPIGVSPDVGVDSRVLLFAIAVTAITGIAFGLVPARRAARQDVNDRLRDGGPTVAGRQGLSSTLVVVQVAISIVLLVTAGLFGRTLVNLSSADLGFDANVATVGADPGLQGYTADETSIFYDQLLERIASTPGVAGVSYVNALPGSGGDDVSSFFLEGNRLEDVTPRAFFNLVGPDYFEVMRIPILQGRGISASDGPGAPPVLVVNASAAARIEELTGSSALGARVSGNGPDGPFIEVVGIAADSTASSIQSATQPRVYLPRWMFADGSLGARMTMVVRGTGAPEAVLDAAVAAVRDLDAGIPTFNVGTLANFMRESLAQERLTTTAIASAALVALGLALVGLYGILACTVSSRSSEFGIRMALGAHGGEVVGLVLKQAAVLFGVGAVVGIAASAAMARLIEGFLYGVSSADPVTYVGVLALMLLVSLGAAWLPARRATRLDPVRALRAE